MTFTKIKTIMHNGFLYYQGNYNNLKIYTANLINFIKKTHFLKINADPENKRGMNYKLKNHLFIVLIFIQKNIKGKHFKERT